jgi:hypothetical protein
MIKEHSDRQCSHADGTFAARRAYSLMQVGSVQGSDSVKKVSVRLHKALLSSMTNKLITGLNEINLCFNKHYDTFETKYAA